MVCDFREWRGRDIRINDMSKGNFDVYVEGSSINTIVY